MARSIRELYSTNYITDGLADKLASHLRTTEDVLDLEGSMLTKRISSIIEGNPHRFVDSVNEDRSNLLAYNREVRDNRLRYGEKVHPIPTLKDTNVIDFLQSIDLTKVYSVTNSIQFATAAFLLAMLPEVPITFATILPEFINYIGRTLYGNNINRFKVFHTSTMYMSKGITLDPVTVEIKSDKLVVADGKVSKMMDLLPGDFLSGKRLNEDERYLEYVLAITKRMLPVVKQQPSLYDYLTRE